MIAHRKIQKGDPVHVAKSGVVRIPVYQSERAKGNKVYDSYRFCHTDGDGQRHQMSFSQLEQAIAAADLLAKDISCGAYQSKASASSMSVDEVREYRDFKRVEMELAKIAGFQGRSLLSVVNGDVIPSARTLAQCNVCLNEAAIYYNRSFENIIRVTVAEAADLFDKAKKKNEDHRFLMAEVGRLVKRYGHLQLLALKTPMIARHLEDRYFGLEPKTQKNARSRLVTFLLWTEAPEASFAPSGYFETLKLRMPKVDEGIKEPCTIENLKKLIDSVTDQIVLICILLCKDAGIRVSEIPRLRWRYVSLQKKKLMIPGKDRGVRITKTAELKEIPLRPHLMEVLKTYMAAHNPDPDSLICPFEDWGTELRSLAEKAGANLPFNGLRHGYGTHRYNLTKNAGKVAFEMGNTEPALKTHYVTSATPAESNAWFAA